MAGESPQNPPVWVPSARQASVLEAAQTPGIDRSITAICAEAGVDRSTYYAWMKTDPGFKAAWERIWMEALDGQFAGIVAAVIKKAQAGGVGAARLAAELKGVLAKRIELTGKDGGPVRTLNLDELSDAQLDALIALDPSLAGVVRPERPATPAQAALPAPGEPDGA